MKRATHREDLMLSATQSFQKPFVLSREPVERSKHEWCNRPPFDKLRANGYISHER